MLLRINVPLLIAAIEPHLHSVRSFAMQIQRITLQMSRECSGGLLGVIWVLDMPRYSQVDSLVAVAK